ncbi:MAG: complex I NDUFA9 subunit family protein [Nitrospirota bacterium]
MLFIAGGTGFVGRHLIRSLTQGTYRARCLIRTPHKADLCSSSGFQTIAGDITDRESLRGALEGCSIAVHLVGIIEEKGSVTFEKVHVEGTRNLVEEAQRAKVRHVFYQSALGASVSAGQRYLKTKAEAEEIVKASGIPSTIFRPSLIIGPDDGFTEKLKTLVSLGPFVPVPGSGTAKFQPLSIDDWVRCFATVFPDSEHPPERGSAGSKIFEIGGPEHLTYNELLTQFMGAMGVRKPIRHIPMEMVKMSLPFAKLSSAFFGLLGKTIPTVTAEQLELLQADNICDRDAISKQFGFTPVTYREALKKFMPLIKES